MLAELRQREEKREQPPCFDAGGPEQQEQPGPESQKTDAELREMLDMINWMREKVQRDQLVEQQLLVDAAADHASAAADGSADNSSQESTQPW